MRNYIILNDVNSNTINGLLIQELPPISKPKMRTQIEEIDGRAGDIVTQLGYAAYTKTISVGLYGDFDIDEVISYFNSSGTVVFSNEPDKYYNYEIIDQIDFNRLVRFRTAKVKMHVQPFKYPTEEEPLVAQYQLVTNTGSDMSLDNTANALFRKLDLKGNTSQTGTPTPDAPVDVKVVSGNNKINICGKNLLNITDSESGGIDASGQEASGNTLWRGNVYIPVSPNTQYTLSSNKAGLTLRLYEYNANKQFINPRAQGFGSLTITTTNNTKYLRWSLYNGGNQITQQDVGGWNLQIAAENQASNYEPYQGQSYPINLGKNLCFNVLSGKTIDSTGKVVNNTSYSLGLAKVIANKTYTFQAQGLGDTSIIGYFTSTPDYGSTTYNNSRSVLTDYNRTFTAPITGYVAFRIPVDGTKVQIEEGTQATSYAPYFTPIELCKIGDYQDYIYKDNGTWWLYKEIGKYTFDGTEDFLLRTSGSGKYCFSIDSLITNNKYETNAYSNYFKAGYTLGGWSGAFDKGIGLWFHDSTPYLYLVTNVSTTSIELQTWLGNNKPSLYYVLNTPTTTEITDSTLIEQLEALKNATSYENQTNISHEYNGSPFILDVAAVQKGTDTLVINNGGNIYARPTLDIEGTGIVNVYLEGNQMFQVDLSENNEIVIDTDEMEAYDPSTQALMNRQVTGNYDNFKIVAGNNNLKFSGDLTKATVTNYERWL